MISICLHRTETEGNIGAIARVMKNFSFSELILVDPLCNHLSEESRRRSKHSVEILENAKIKKNFNFLKKYDIVIGTTSIVGTDYNILRSPIEVREYLKLFVESLGTKKIFNSRIKKLNILILFGNEGTGLTTEELVLCDQLITIDTSKEYSALNLSHAVGIILYEFSRVFPKKILDKKFIPKDKVKNDSVELATREEKVRLVDIASDLVEDLYDSSSKIKPVSDSIKKMISKSILTKREVFSLMGFFKQLKRNMKKN